VDPLEDVDHGSPRTRMFTITSSDCPDCLERKSATGRSASRCGSPRQDRLEHRPRDAEVPTTAWRKN
jgi:hypothetical protein